MSAHLREAKGSQQNKVSKEPQKQSFCGLSHRGAHTTSDQPARLFASFVTFLSNKEKLVKTFPFPKGFREMPCSCADRRYSVSYMHAGLLPPRTSAPPSRREANRLRTGNGTPRASSPTNEPKLVGSRSPFPKGFREIPSADGKQNQRTCLSQVRQKNKRF